MKQNKDLNDGNESPGEALVKPRPSPAKFDEQSDAGDVEGVKGISV